MLGTELFLKLYHMMTLMGKECDVSWVESYREYSIESIDLFLAWFCTDSKGYCLIIGERKIWLCSTLPPLP